MPLVLHSECNSQACNNFAAAVIGDGHLGSKDTVASVLTCGSLYVGWVVAAQARFVGCQLPLDLTLVH